MESLERKIRKALIEQRTEQLVEQVSQNEEYKQKVQTIAEIMMNTMLGFIDSSKNEESAEYMQKYQQDLQEQIKEQTENPRKLKELLKQQAVIEHYSYRQLKLNAKDYLSSVLTEDVNERFMKDSESKFQEIEQYTKKNDEIIQKLVEIAKTEGLQKATKIETKYEIIKQIFPNKEDYKEFLEKGTTFARNLLQQSQQSLKQYGVAEHFLNNAIDAAQRIIELNKEIYDARIYSTLNNIYQ